jgi:hypothetical protein
MTDTTVAIYWDFENLHAALFEELHGTGAYRNKDRRFGPQDVLVNVRAILDFAASLGSVSISRAYANWQWLARYRDELSDGGLELIQLYPRGARASADVKLAMDIVEDLGRSTHIGTVILVGGDADHSAIAQKIRECGRRVIGIAPEQTASGFWVRACDEFKFYHWILARSEGQALETDAEALDQARELLGAALRRAVAQTGQMEVSPGLLQTVAQRLDPSFDPGHLGATSLTELLSGFSDMVELTGDGRVRFKTGASAATRPATPNRSSSYSSGGGYGRERSIQDRYEYVLYRGTFRPLPYPWWRRGVECYEEAIRAHGDRYMPTFEYWEEQAAKLLAAKGLDSDPLMAHRLRGSLWALRQFVLLPDRNGVSLADAVWDKELTLLESVDEEIVRRLLRYGLAPLDVDAVGRILFGPEAEAHREEVIDAISIVAEELGMKEEQAYNAPASGDAPASEADEPALLAEA